MSFKVTLLASVLVVNTFLFSLPRAGADEYYPQHLKERYFGANQGNVGSCAAEAEIEALESAFAQRGHFVRLSRFYRHAKNAKPNDGLYDRTFTQADHDLIARAGEIIPEYIWPETGEGYDPAKTGMRLRPSQSVLLDPAFVKVDSKSFISFYSFVSENLDSLKRAIKAGKAITLKICDQIFYEDGDYKVGHPSFDHATGLLKIPYELRKFEKLSSISDCGRGNGRGSHLVSVVGYDDSLYAEYDIKGALIVRNSWNNWEITRQSGYGPWDPSIERELSRFKYKINRNYVLTGYYAIPYKFMFDLIRAGKYGYYIYDLDYDRFADQYHKLSVKYERRLAPFVCEVEKEHKSGYASETARDRLRLLQTYFKGRKELRDIAKDRFFRLVNAEASLRGQGSNSNDTPTFNFATLTYHRDLGVDQVSEFYKGAYSSYYCNISQNDAPSQRRTVWPYYEHTSGADIRTILNELGYSPYEPKKWFRFFKALGEARAADDYQ